MLNELGRVISYRGTTVEEVREMRREAEAGLKAERKKKFQTLRKKFDNMEQRSRATLREERKLTGGERAAKKVAGEVAKVRG